MSLNDAKAYCESIGARVPFEAEWEYAARAGATAHHYWGNNTDQRPEPVGRKRPNTWGLYTVSAARSNHRAAASVANALILSRDREGAVVRSNTGHRTAND